MVSGIVAAPANVASGLVPGKHRSYVRILHRVVLNDGTTSTWGAAADRGGVRLGAASRWGDLSQALEHAGGSRWEGAEPDTGQLDEGQMHALVRILRRETDPNQECVFLLWNAYGPFVQGSDGELRRAYVVPARSIFRRLLRARIRRSVVRGATASSRRGTDAQTQGLDPYCLLLSEGTRWGVPTGPPRPSGRASESGPSVPMLETQIGEFVPLAGTFAALGRFGHLGGPSNAYGMWPSIWWETSLSWAVATDPESHSTYVGCTEPIAELLLHDAELEAIRVEPQTPVD